MTQDLVVGVLLTGMVGLIWAMAVTVLWGDQGDHASSSSDSHSEQDGIKESGSEHRAIAA